MAKTVYDQDDGGFTFSKGRRTRAAKEQEKATLNTIAERNSPTKLLSQPRTSSDDATDGHATATKPVEKKTRRRLPTTPERNVETRTKIVRRSKRLSDEGSKQEETRQTHRPAHARSHANTERSPSPEKARPITIEKKRRKNNDDSLEEEKIMRIQLPFQDTPVIRRNKDMRKSNAANLQRRSSSGMRGRRASGLIEDGRGNGKLSPSKTSFQVQV